MVLDLRRSKRHRATNVFDLQPRAVKTFWRRTLRQNSGSALLHHLRNEFVRIEQRPTNCGEEDAFTNTPRIVTYIRDDPRFITANLRAGYLCQSFNSCHGFTITAGMF